MAFPPFGRALSAAILLLAGGLACTSTGSRPGTGDLSFRLRWDGPADLDLHVEDPHGHHVGVLLPHDVLSPEERARSAEPRPASELDDIDEGILDVDCNASPERICPNPIENVFWPTGTAPRGVYRARIVLFQKLHGEDEVPFVLEIREGERIVRKIPGRVGDRRRVSDWIEFAH